MAAPQAHAALPCSGAHRWKNCPGSVKLSEQYPQGSTIYADEGTLAHEAAEQLITKGKVTAGHKKTIASFYKDHPELGGTVDEMLETLEPYVGFVVETYNEQLKEDPATQILTEQRVDLTRWIPEGFGTSDVIIIRSGYMQIIDLKYGKGVPVSAEDNPQLRLYALGSLEMLDSVYEVKDVAMTIYQPRLDNISTELMSAADLYEWADTEIAPAAKLALTDNAPFKAGDWCRFCPARHECRARAESYLDLAEYMAKACLTNDEIAQVLGRIDGLVKWAEDLKEGALTRALNGEDFAGWKVVEGRSIRKYSGTEEEIVKQCEGAGFDRAMLYETKLLGVSAMEKLLGKKQFGEILGAYVEKPQGKPTLAPETDKRPAIVGGSAAEDFANE